MTGHNPMMGMLGAMMGGGGLSLDIRCAVCAAAESAPEQPVTLIGGTLVCATHARQLLVLDGHIPEVARLPRR